MLKNALEQRVNTPPMSVIYNGNGNTGGSEPVDPQLYRKGESAPVADNTGSMTNSGYYFTGWTTNADGAGTAYTVGQNIVLGTSDINLYAKWVNTTASSITFSSNGATGGSAPVYYTYYEPGQYVYIPGNPGNLVMPGYSFTGWNTAADGTGVTYTQSQVYLMPATNITLYAEWTDNPVYTITYDKNGADNGAVPVDSTNYLTGQSAVVQSNSGNLSLTGYTFVGWNTQADGNGTDYAPGASITVTSNITLYAKWSSLPLTWSDTTAPRATSHVQNTSIRIDWTPLANAVKYEIYYATSVNPTIVETKFDETVNSYYQSSVNLNYIWRIKAIDSLNAVIDQWFVNFTGATINTTTPVSGIYSDNFDDSIVAASYYLKNPGQASESGGYFQLNQNVTDNGPLLHIVYDTGGKRYLHIKFNKYQHRTNGNYYGDLTLYSYGNNYYYIVFSNVYDNYYAIYGTYVGYALYNEQIPATAQRDSLDPTQYFDVWFLWDIYIDILTGVTNVSINGLPLGSSNTGIVLNSKIVLRFSSSQWFTGAYVWIDDLLIESSDTPY